MLGAVRLQTEHTHTHTAGEEGGEWGEETIGKESMREEGGREERNKRRGVQRKVEGVMCDHVIFAHQRKQGMKRGRRVSSE